MATRASAALIILAAVAVAWLAVSAPLVARLLQAVIVVSMAYVAWLAWNGWRVMRRAQRPWPEGTEQQPDALPFVSLLVPARNEARAVGGTVRSLAALDYADAAGAPCYEVLVVDDGSTDSTPAVATEAAAGLSTVRVVTREPGERPHTKGAVLAWASALLRGDIVGVIDADTRVDPGFLGAVLRAWSRDPDASAIQVRRLPRNADASWLTGAQADEQLMDLASQCGRWGTDGTAELRGNGMFVRRAALEAAGGWSATALTEDLELSTRLAATGKRVAMAPEAVVAEEAVEGIRPLWRQRLRWAEGSLRRLLEGGPALLLGPQPLSHKLDFLAFAGEFAVPPLFAATLVAGIVTIPLPQSADWTVPASLAAAYAVGIFALALAGLHATGERGTSLVLRALRGSAFLLHWLIVIPFVLVRIAIGPATDGFEQTPRFLDD